MPARKRKVTYPAPRTATRAVRPGAGGDNVRQGVIEIDLNAGNGRPGLAIGGRVRILGSGLYAGEDAVIERFVGGVIPAAFVRTTAGRTRQARTVDLEPLPDPS